MLIAIIIKLYKSNYAILLSIYIFPFYKFNDISLLQLGYKVNYFFLKEYLFKERNEFQMNRYSNYIKRNVSVSLKRKTSGFVDSTDAFTDR